MAQGEKMEKRVHRALLPMEPGPIQIGEPLNHGYHQQLEQQQQQHHQQRRQPL